MTHGEEGIIYLRWGQGQSYMEVAIAPRLWSFKLGLWAKDNLEVRVREDPGQDREETISGEWGLL